MILAVREVGDLLLVCVVGDLMGPTTAYKLNFDILIFNSYDL